MEGIGYWLIIAALYLLSSIMKKRKQQTTRRKLNQEDSVPDSEQKQSPVKSDFLQNLFGDIKEMVEGSELVPEQVKDDFVTPESDGSFQYEPEQTTIPEPTESDEPEFEDFGKKVPEPIRGKYQYWEGEKISHYHLSPILKDMHNLKQAIVLKEILDKPRAMRREIR